MTIAFDDEMVGGELLGAQRGRVRSYPPGRVCAADGCHTVLSVYNARARCAVHDFHDFHAELGQLARHPSVTQRGALAWRTPRAA
jgi:hypothetical protein